MKLKEYLKRENLSQASFGRLIGISRFYVNKLVHETMTPSFKVAKKIQEATKGLVTIDDFPIEPRTKKKA